MPTSLSVGLSRICLGAGFASIVASIAIWALMRGEDAAHAERFGIFVGLWAPTFMILSERLRGMMIGKPAAAGLKREGEAPQV